MKASALRQKVGNLRQLGCVRRIVLDDGGERGVRALAFSTGGGLDFWVLADRSLDIGPLWWRGQTVGWQGPTGFQHPDLHDREAADDRGFNRSFSGFLVTCGLEHIRQPANGRPLHGRLPFTPARITASGTDWERETPLLFCEGEVIQAQSGREHFRLRRRIEAPVGGVSFAIHDTVENLGAAPQRQASLYHFNIGFPALADGVIVESGGRYLLGPLRVPDAAASREAMSRPVGIEGRAQCAVRAMPLDGGPVAVTFAWSAATLPHLQLWHDLRPGRCVLSVEPCTSERLQGGLSGAEPMLEPGEIRRYDLQVSVAAELQGR